ncbi:MAG: NYN domain-containing protein [Cellulomonas sp.]|uniref:NYN domain-containing protein n=1 Tax=Cellulomonas sp. 73-92 TaxID=1895740 RepID=UPI000AEB05CD|nr:NYN domain-containing protein [Cellulomonas sp. 73-92]MBN9374027.1 NYN domain-containing protein [Cellulomonas sp.]
MTVTEPASGDTRRLRCALFVDFDNVLIGLQQLDARLADRFATDPGHWLGELATGADDDGTFTRRFLVLNCYLNPARFSEFRPHFTRAGFQVVDCPSLTQQGKSSADINLVLDAVDALAAPTRYDEFVILSADADFTPLIQRCRANDRRVTVVTASPAASAYRAVADTVMDATAFVELVTQTGALAGEDASGTAPTIAVPAQRAPEPSGEARTAAAPKRPASSAGSQKGRRAIVRLLQTADRPVPLSAAAQAAQQADPNLPGSKWESAGTFSAWLARELPDLRTTKEQPGGYVWDPTRFDDADLPAAPASPKDVTEVQQRVIRVTDIPGLTQATYGVLLGRLAADVHTHPFDTTATARRVYEACQKAGAKVGQATVRQVIAGILYSGLKLTASKPDARQLAKAWADNVIGLCRGAQMQLSKADEKNIRTWVTGGLLEPSH